jgi:hypothetical protein
MRAYTLGAEELVFKGMVGYARTLFEALEKSGFTREGQVVQATDKHRNLMCAKSKNFTLLPDPGSQLITVTVIRKQDPNYTDTMKKLRDLKGHTGPWEG